MIFRGEVGIRPEERTKIKSQNWTTKHQALDKKLTEWSRYAIERYV
jgi:hypothetical protein